MLKWHNTSQVKVGSILYCKYPSEDEILQKYGEPHYVLVIGLGTTEKDSGKFKVVFGTSKNTLGFQIQSDELLISDTSYPDFAKTGLQKPTKFVFSKSVYLEYDYENFLKKANWNSPLVGEIDITSQNIKNRLLQIDKFLNPPPPQIIIKKSIKNLKK